MGARQVAGGSIRGKRAALQAWALAIAAASTQAKVYAMNHTCRPELLLPTNIMYVQARLT